MARPPSKDPHKPVTATIPESLHRKARKDAERCHMSLSAWLAMLIRDHFMSDARERG